MDVNFVKTPKKYEDRAEEVLNVLFLLLGELLTVQERAALCYRRLEQKQLTYNEKTQKRIEIFDKCEEEYAEIITGRCTEKEMKLNHLGSLGQIPEYAYLNGEYTVDFTMKAADTATVITHYLKGERGRKHKFVLRLVDGKWLVDEVHSGSEGERRWFYTEL